MNVNIKISHYLYEKQQDMLGIYRDLIYAVLIRQCVKLGDNDRCS